MAESPKYLAAARYQALTCWLAQMPERFNVYACTSQRSDWSGIERVELHRWCRVVAQGKCMMSDVLPGDGLDALKRDLIR